MVAAILPALDMAAELCEITSRQMYAVAYLPYREPSCGVDEFDTAHGTPQLPDPLLTTHRLSRFYLLGAAELLDAVGRLLHPPQLGVSTATLARATAEYAALAKYIADPDDSPQMRLAKCGELLRGSFNYNGAPKPDAPQGFRDLARTFPDWQQGRGLPKPPRPIITKLVADLHPSLGADLYNELSAVAHADVIAVSTAVVVAQMQHPKMQESAWKHALFATQCGLFGAVYVCALRDGDRTPLNHCRALLHAAEIEFDRYLWDRAVEMGFTPDRPRP